jgi:hypothetical protein
VTARCCRLGCPFPARAEVVFHFDGPPSASRFRLPLCFPHQLEIEQQARREQPLQVFDVLPVRGVNSASIKSAPKSHGAEVSA